MKLPSPVSKRRARIEIIPLIDIIFFLLATFVMVSLSMVKNEGIMVHVPQAKSSHTQEAASIITISIDRDGRLYVDKDKVTLDELLVRLKQLKALGKDTSVIINGDEQAEFGVAVHVLDEVRRIGIEKVGIRTRS